LTASNRLHRVLRATHEMKVAVILSEGKDLQFRPGGELMQILRFAQNVTGKLVALKKKVGRSSYG